MAFARLIGVLAVVARFDNGFLGISGILRQALATGLKKLSSSVLLKSKIFLLVFSKGSLISSELAWVVDNPMKPAIRTKLIKLFKFFFHAYNMFFKITY